MSNTKPKGVSVLESHSIECGWKEKFYSDEEILDLFPDDSESIVNPLLHRAQAAEAEIERLREALHKITVGLDGDEIRRHNGEVVWWRKRALENLQERRRLYSEIERLKNAILDFLKWENKSEHSDTEWLQATETLVAKTVGGDWWDCRSA